MSLNQRQTFLDVRFNQPPFWTQNNTHFTNSLLCPFADTAFSNNTNKRQPDNEKGQPDNEKKKNKCPLRLPDSLITSHQTDLTNLIPSTHGGLYPIPEVALLSTIVKKVTQDQC